MKPDYGRCDLCRKGNLQLKEKKMVAGTTYSIIRCNKCSHEIVKRVEQ